jgi:hypothetical protein
MAPNKGLIPNDMNDERTTIGHRVRLHWKATQLYIRIWKGNASNEALVIYLYSPISSSPSSLGQKWC